MNFTHPPQTDEQKSASIQLNNIGTINALNTHNWELQQKVQTLTAENERLREALKPFADAADEAYRFEDHDGIYTKVGYLRAAAAAIRETGE